MNSPRINCPLFRRGELAAAKAAVHWVAEAAGVNPDGLRRRSRSEPLGFLRQTCYWLVIHATGSSAKATGRLFARHHTSVLHGLRQVNAARASNESYRQLTDYLLDRVRHAVGSEFAQVVNEAGPGPAPAAPPQPEAWRDLHELAAKVSWRARKQEADRVLSALLELHPEARQIFEKDSRYHVQDLRMGALMALRDAGWNPVELSKLFKLSKGALAKAARRSKARLGTPGYALLERAYHAAMRALKENEQSINKNH